PREQAERNFLARGPMDAVPVLVGQREIADLPGECACEPRRGFWKERGATRQVIGVWKSSDLPAQLDVADPLLTRERRPPRRRRRPLDAVQRVAVPLDGFAESRW